MKWIASGGGLSFAMNGTAPCSETDGAVIVRVGETADALPAPLLPGSGRSLPALTQHNPADVISGWVRLWIAGFLAERGGSDGIVCALQGDVSHWVHVCAQEAVSSQSFLTARLIVTLEGDLSLHKGALVDSLSRPERLAAYLRHAEISGDRAATTGYLVGAELAAARPYWLGQQVIVIGDGEMTRVYAQALATQGCAVMQRAISDVLPSGLAALAHALDLAE